MILGLRAILPDCIENQIIDFKNNIFKNGLLDGLKSVFENVVDIGKNILRMNNISVPDKIVNIKDSILNSDFINTIGKELGKSLDSLINLKDSNNDIYNIINDNKEIIISNFKSNLNEEFKFQNKLFYNINNEISNWKENLSNENYEGMEKSFKLIQQYNSKIMPIDNIVKDINYIESIHKLLANNNSISSEELELAQKLV